MITPECAVMSAKVSVLCGNQLGWILCSVGWTSDKVPHSVRVASHSRELIC